MDDKLLSTGEVAKALGVHPGTVTNWRAWGIGPKYVRKGRRVFYKHDAVEQYRLNMKGTGT